MKPAVIRLSLIISLLASPAWAALNPGDAAPDFTLQAAQAGKDFTFHLADSLKTGPVVLYFYPKSFTKGCTAEAHEFAETIGDFAAVGASVIGVSADPIAVQKDFSSLECRDKFPVAADPDRSVIRAYDAARATPTDSGEILADRISYVISPEGAVLLTTIDKKPEKHIEASLEAVRQWRQAHPAK
jgi:peroxiredoxin